MTADLIPAEQFQEMMDHMNTGLAEVRGRLEHLTARQLAETLVALLQENNPRYFKANSIPTLAEDRAVVAVFTPEVILEHVTGHLWANPHDWAFVPEKLG